jgi:hypothetical protein
MTNFERFENSKMQSNSKKVDFADFKDEPSIPEYTE